MGYPDAPNFQSGAAYSAWWKAAQQDGSRDVCATQGRTFIRQLQTAINRVVAGGIWNNPWDATDVHAGAISVDGNWGSMTQQGLGHLAVMKGAPADMLATLQRDYASNTAGQPGNQFSGATVLAAIWVSQHPDLDLSKIDLMDNVIAPRWDVTPGDEGSARQAITCWNEASVPPTATDPRTSIPLSQGGAVSSDTGNPISQPGLLGSTAGGTSTGILFLAGTVLATTIVVGVLASRSRTTTRYRTRRSKR